MFEQPYECKDCKYKFDLSCPVDIIICPECGSENITFYGADIND